MIFTDFAAHIRYKTKTNSTLFTDIEIMRLANIYIEKFAQRIVEADEDILGTKFEANLVAGQRQYSLPNDLIKLKRVEINLDGTDWVIADEIDIAFMDVTSDESSITTNFEDTDPKYRIFQNSLYIYSGSTIIDVANGLKMWGLMYPAPITDLSFTTDMSEDPSTISRGMPKQLHELLARKVIIAYKESKDKPIPLSEDERSFEFDLKRAINDIRNINLDRDAEYMLPYNDGSNY